MTKDVFIKTHQEKGYTIQDLGGMVILTIDNLVEIYYFTEDGELDNRIEPFWCLVKNKRG